MTAFDSESTNAECRVAFGQGVLVDHRARCNVDHLNEFGGRIADIQARFRLVELDPVRDDPVHLDAIDDLLGCLVPDEHLVGVRRDVPRSGLSRRRGGRGAEEECRDGDPCRRSHEAGES
jgi:hypothetical protein